METNVQIAQRVLTQIEEKCKDILDLESSVEMSDYIELKLSSEDIVEYEDLTSRFVQNLMHVEVEEVINKGFLCNFSKCETTFFLGKRRVLGLMIHILQDITLFRNFLKIPQYIQMFSAIVKRQLSVNLIKDVNKTIKSEKSQMDQLLGRIRQINSGGGMVLGEEHSEEKERCEKKIYQLQSRLDSLHREVKLWEGERKISGEDADRIKTSIEGQSDDDIFTTIVDKIPSDRESRREISILLRKVIYLRHLDNLCNTMLSRIERRNEEEIQKRIDKHQAWIEVLERVSREVIESIDF